MDQIMSLFPKWLLAVLVIAGGMAAIILYNPPHTVCESQIEVFRDAQKRFLFNFKEKKRTKIAKYRELVDHCKMTNDPGGCYELFQETKVMLNDLKAVPSDCLPTVGSIGAVKTALWEVEDLLIRLGWGDKPPTAYREKFHWLDTADVSLYCGLKQTLTDTYGLDAWEAFRQKTSHALPGADKLTDNEAWQKTLFSENCAAYP